MEQQRLPLESVTKRDPEVFTDLGPFLMEKLAITVVEQRENRTIAPLEPEHISSDLPSFNTETLSAMHALITNTYSLGNIAIAEPTVQYWPSCPFKVKALYDFAARDAYELSMMTGDIIMVIEKKFDEWWFGELPVQSGDFVHGLIPKNHVELVNDYLPVGE